MVQSKWTISRCTVHWTSFLESMGKQLNSSRIFPRIHNNADLTRKSKKTWNARTLNKNCFLTKSSSCQRSRILFGQQETLKKLALRIQREYKLNAQRFPQGHWTFIGPGAEMKSMVQDSTDLKENGNSIAAKLVQNFNETKHPVFTSISALNSAILRMIKGKSSIHFNAESTNSQLLFRIIFSANQLNVYGWGRENLRNQGIRRIMSKYTPRVDEERRSKWSTLLGIYSETDEGSRKRVQRKCENIRWHAHAQSDLYALWSGIVEEKSTRRFLHYKTKFARRTRRNCKEYTFSRSDPRSRIHCKIPGGTKIGPVIHIKIVRIFCSSWNRSFSSFNNGSFQNVLGTDFKREKSVRRWNGRSQYQFQCLQHQFAQRFRKRERATNSWSSSMLETNLNKQSEDQGVSFDQDERQTAGAVHWDVIKSVLEKDSRIKARKSFVNLNGYIIISTKEATKCDSNTVKLLRKHWRITAWRMERIYVS